MVTVGPVQLGAVAKPRLRRHRRHCRTPRNTAVAAVGQQPLVGKEVPARQLGPHQRPVTLTDHIQPVQ